jgi:hypothetical protein
MQGSQMSHYAMTQRIVDGSKEGGSTPHRPHAKNAFFFEFLIEWNFAPKTFLGEVRIRSIWILIGLGLTWFTHDWFLE